MKILVATTGNFQLLDPEAGQLIRHEGYTLVSTSNFVKLHQTLEHIELIGQTNDDATDEEWLKYVAESDGDLELATPAFLSSFEYKAPVKEGEPAPEPTETAKKGPKGKPVAPATE